MNLQADTFFRLVLALPPLVIGLLSAALETKANLPQRSSPVHRASLAGI